VKVVDGGENERASKLSPRNTEPERERTQPGITRDFKRTSAKEKAAICCNCEGCSKLKDVRELHRKKHRLERTSTVAGRRMDVKAVSQNASFSILDSLEPDSNVIDASALQEAKHD
jgi:hypothetical protein